MQRFGELSGLRGSLHSYEIDMSSSSEPGDESSPSPFSRPTPIVFVVDDDVSVRESLELLIRSAGWRVETFASAQEFLAHPRVNAPSCLVLDVTLPDLNGLDLQKRVAVDRTDMPIIFITGNGDVPMTVQAMKAGAVEFLTKPFWGRCIGERHPACHRMQPRCTWPGGGNTGAPQRLRLTHPSRARGHGIGCLRLFEQTGW